MTTEEAVARGYIRLLGHYEPAWLSTPKGPPVSEEIAQDRIRISLCEITGIPRAEVRKPSSNQFGQADYWHRDCGGSPEKIIVWSNVHPTEVRAMGAQEEIEIRAYDVVELANRICEHRTPEAARRSTTRWFARLIRSYNWL